MIFGELFDEVNNFGWVAHTIVCYGYTPSNSLICHYGWPPSSVTGKNYNKIVLNSVSVIGQYLQMRSLSSKVVPIYDVPSTHWAYKAVQYNARYNLQNIYNGGYVYPDTYYRYRFGFCVALYKLAGYPEIKNGELVEKQFSDFKETRGSTMYNAAVWAYQQGIITGTSATTLDLSSFITREQAITMLNKFSNAQKVTFSNTNGPAASSFSDYNTISSWARTQMDWATRRYIIAGSGGKLNPQQNLKSVEACQMIYNFVQSTSH